MLPVRLLFGLLTLTVMLPAMAVAADAQLRDFVIEPVEGNEQVFQINFDRSPSLRVYDELLENRYFYIDFYQVADPGGDRDWSPSGAGVFHIKQIYYKDARVLRYVFYCRGDAWFAAQTRGGGSHEIRVRPIAYTNLDMVAGARSGVRKRVVIDAGHGGIPGQGRYHVGARTSREVNGRHYYEKEITLKIAEMLADMINKAPNLEAVMTRTEDVYVGLEERVDLARAAHGDMFVSIHLNATGTSSKARGFEIYYLSDGTRETNRELVALENEGVDLDDTLSHNETLRDLIRQLADEAMGLRQNESRRLCEVIGEEFRTQGPFVGNYRGVKSAPFRVLMNFEMPAVLAECGFLDHPEEGALLTKPEVQRQIAVLLFNGINRYFAMEDPSFRPTRVAVTP